MTTQEQVILYLIDDGRDINILLNEAHRYGTKAAAKAHRKPGDGLWKITGAAIPSNQITE